MGKGTATPESRILEAAFKGRPRGYLAQVARDIGVEPNNLSHWIHGRRPVPAVYARPLGNVLGLEPAGISAAFAAVADTEPGNVIQHPAEAKVSPEQAASRSVNDVDALRYVVAAMVTAMQVHRPAEASEFARLLRAYAPPKFHNQGFLGELLVSVESRAAPKARAQATTRPRAKP